MTTTATAPSGVVKEARYILTDVTNNNNKFWTIRLFADNSVETHWGRVGESGQRKLKPGMGEAWFDARCREKQCGGYQPSRTLGNGAPGSALGGEALARLATEQIGTDSDETRELVRYLARVNAHRILEATTLSYDESRGTFATPLGIVTEEALVEARDLLNRLAGFVARDAHADSALPRLLSDYLMLIPQNLGRSRPDPKVILPDLDAIRKQNDILDALEASLKLAVAEDEGREQPVAPRLFEARLTRVTDRALTEMIAQMYRDTRQTLHASNALEVRRVFRIDLPAMRTAYAAQRHPADSSRLLWHGTRASNLLSILRTGFLIPPANAPHCTGRMFGNGVYFSDQSTKSLNYAYGYWQGARESRCFMLLCQVALGRSYTPKSWQESFPRAGYDSTFARAGVSGVQNNEFVVYETARIAPEYLIEFGSEEK